MSGRTQAGRRYAGGAAAAVGSIRQKAGSKRLLLYQADYEAAVLALRSTMGDEASGRAGDKGTALTPWRRREPRSARAR